MRCYTCESEVALARKVKLRPWVEFDTEEPPDSAAYLAYVEAMTYRWSVVCLPCYRQLDNFWGLAEIGGRLFNMAGASRFDKAAIIDEAKYKKFLKKEAAKVGVDL